MRIIITEEQFKSLNEVRVKSQDRVKLYQDDNLLVVVPLTHTASCKYGANTKWCTAVPSNSSHYEEYTKEGVLIYFIITSPYKDTNKPQYKFAYYESFNPNFQESNGWYDMSDYQLPQDEEALDAIDKNLIKFLIPEKVFNIAKEYIKSQKPIYEENLKKNFEQFYEKFKNDPENIKIVDDAQWLIGYRTTPFPDEEYSKYGMLLPYDINPELRLIIFYIDKKKQKAYEQTLQYYDDIRNSKYNDMNFSYFQNLATGDAEFLIKIFKKYYNKISKEYFKSRKKYFKPRRADERIMLRPEEIEVKEDYYAVFPKSQLIVNVEWVDGRYQIDTITDTGKINKGVYYDEVRGVPVAYDKERHNPS